MQDDDEKLWSDSDDEETSDYRCGSFEKSQQPENSLKKTESIMPWEVKLLPPHVLKSVPGYYEPVFDLNAIPEIKGFRPNQEKKSFIDQQLSKVLAGVYGRNPPLGKDKSTPGKLNKEDASRLGDRILLSTLRGNPLFDDVDGTIKSYNNKPSGSLVKRSKAIKAAHEENLEYIERNYEAIFNQLVELKQAKVERKPENYPPHYETFFAENLTYGAQDEDLKEQLIKFFSDYSKPQKSDYNQNYVFLKIKEASRHYTPLADAVVNALKDLKVGEERSRNYEANSMSDDKDRLEAVLKQYREQLVQTMVGEKRDFKDSHLLRRIDYALEKIEAYRLSENTENRNDNSLI